MVDITVNTTVSSDFETERAASHSSPYKYVTINISSEGAVDITDYVINISSIDRGSPNEPGSVSQIRAGDASIIVSNSDGYFSPEEPTSIFYGKDYYDAEIIVYAGFYLDDNNIEVTSQAVVLLERVELRDNDGVVQLYGRGKSKKALEKRVGEPDSDGLADPLTFMGDWKFIDIIEYLLKDVAGLATTEYSVQDLSIFYRDIVFKDMTISTAIAYLAESSNTRIWEDRFGVINIEEFIPVFAGEGDELNLELYTKDVVYTTDFTMLVNKVRVHYGGDNFYLIDNTETQEVGRYIIVNNPYVQKYSVAKDIGDKIITKFGTRDDIPIIQVNAHWLPDIDIGDVVVVVSNLAGLASEYCRINQIVMDMSQHVTQLVLEKTTDIGGYTWGFLGSSVDEGDGLSPQSDTFAGASTEDKEFAYCAVDSASAAPMYYAY